MQPERPIQTTLAFHASRIVIDVGVLLATGSMSLTFVSAPDGGRSALAADALPALLLLLPIFVVTLIPDHTRPLHPALGWVSMVLALAALPYAIVKLLDARILADTLGGSVGPGPFVLIFGCVVTLAGLAIGVVRDLLGKPSGGTPQRSAAYLGSRPGSDPAATGTDAGATVDTGPEVASTSDEDHGTDDAETRVDGTPDGTDGATPPPESSQPEILFPDTGAVAREAEPELDAADDLMNTAERADAALSGSLWPMFDDAEPPDDGPDEESDQVDGSP